MANIIAATYTTPHITPSNWMVLLIGIILGMIVRGKWG